MAPSYVCDRSGRLGSPSDPAVLDKSLSTAYGHMVDLFPSTTAIGVPSPALQVHNFWNQDPVIFSL